MIWQFVSRSINSSQNSYFGDKDINIFNPQIVAKNEITLLPTQNHPPTPRMQQTCQMKPG